MSLHFCTKQVSLKIVYNNDFAPFSDFGKWDEDRERERGQHSRRLNLML